MTPMHITVRARFAYPSEYRLQRSESFPARKQRIAGIIIFLPARSLIGVSPKPLSYLPKFKNCQSSLEFSAAASSMRLRISSRCTATSLGAFTPMRT